MSAPMDRRILERAWLRAFAAVPEHRTAGLDERADMVGDGLGRSPAAKQAEAASPDWTLLGDVEVVRRAAGLAQTYGRETAVLPTKGGAR